MRKRFLALTMSALMAASTITGCIWDGSFLNHQTS